MIRLLRTDSSNSHFQQLVEELDADLAIRDGDDHEFYHQYNSIDMLDKVVVAYVYDIPVGCGAIKTFGDDSMEIKRMFTPVPHRGKGVATAVLKELESWARESGAKSCILETGIANPEAISLYQKHGYERIENYGQYEGVETSRCFLKRV